MISNCSQCFCGSGGNIICNQHQCDSISNEDTSKCFVSTLCNIL